MTNLNGYTTIQRKHSEKWLAKITTVRAFSLDNHFSGAECSVERLRYAIERLGCNLQLTADKLHGSLRVHGNCSYQFDLRS